MILGLSRHVWVYELLVEKKIIVDLRKNGVHSVCRPRRENDYCGWMRSTSIDSVKTHLKSESKPAEKML
jgi:hypothetical protein